MEDNEIPTETPDYNDRGRKSDRRRSSDRKGRLSSE